MSLLAGQLGPLGRANRRQDAAWTPDELATLTLWLDADDASTITASGGNLTAWSDKSSAARPTTVTATPKFNDAQINGLPTVSALAGGNGVVVPMGATLASPTTTFSVVRWRDTNPDWQRFLVTTDDARTHNGGAMFYRRSGNAWATYGLYNSGGFSSGFVGVSNLINTPYLVSFVSGLVGVTNRKVVIDGTIWLNQIPTALEAGNTLLDIHATRVVGTQWGPMDVGEVIVFTGNMADEDRWKVEGYLAHKWGTLASLRADHPYKTEAP